MIYILIGYLLVGSYLGGIFFAISEPLSEKVTTMPVVYRFLLSILFALLWFPLYFITKDNFLKGV